VGRKLLDYCKISGKPVKYFDGIRNYVATADIINGEIISSEEVTYSSKPSRANQNVENNELIFAKMMSTRKVIQISDTNKDFIYSTGFYVLTPNEDVNSRYIYWFLNSDNFNNQKDKNSTGATMKGINNDGLKNILINDMPNIKVQEERAKDLDKIYDAILNRKNSIQDCVKLVNSLYYDSVLKNNCESKKLSEIGKSLIGLTYSPKDICEIGTIVLRSGNIQNGILDFKDIVRVSSDIKETKMVKENDILICSRNGSKRLVGKSVIIPKTDEKMAFGAFMAVYRSEYNEFLIAFFHSDDFKKQLGGSATATINQITSEMLNNIVVMIPPKAILQKIILQIKQIQKQKILLESDLKDLELLLEIKMHQYFS